MSIVIQSMQVDAHAIFALQVSIKLLCTVKNERLGPCAQPGGADYKLWESSCQSIGCDSGDCFEGVTICVGCPANTYWPPAYVPMTTPNIGSKMFIVNRISTRSKTDQCKFINSGPILSSAAGCMLRAAVVCLQRAEHILRFTSKFAR